MYIVPPTTLPIQFTIYHFKHPLPHIHPGLFLATLFGMFISARWVLFAILFKVNVMNNSSQIN